MSFDPKKPFMCDALGKMYEYRCDFSDQMALLMLSHAGTDGILACRLYDSSLSYEFLGTTRGWDQVEHTADQVTAVNRVYIDTVKS